MTEMKMTSLAARRQKLRHLPGSLEKISYLIKMALSGILQRLHRL